MRALKRAEQDEVSYQQQHRSRPGKQVTTVTVPRKPGRAGIDPDDLLIAVKLDDNNRTVKAE